MSEQEGKNQKHYVRAAYAPDGPGAASMIRLLQENGIDAFRQGGVKDIYKIGGEIFGEEIMVAPENLAAARALLQQVPEDESASAPPKHGSSVKKTVLSLLAAVILLMILLFIRGRFLA
jgi:hypothetical protein